MVQKVQKQEEISIMELERGTITFHVLGVTPFIAAAMSQKAKRELLLPRGKKNAAERASTVKHDPIAEYRDSIYRNLDDDAPSRIVVPSTMFKAAMSSVATDIPGVTKAQIGRLTYVNGDYISLYGTPKILCSVVRNSDMNRTPDIRTRAILPTWAAIVDVTFTKPLVKETHVGNLLSAAGLIRGVGDWRPEKGQGNYGQFELVAANDARFLKLVETQGRAPQDAALASPDPYDSETVQLLDHAFTEAEARGLTLTLPA